MKTATRKRATTKAGAGPAVEFAGDEMRVRFGRFDPAAYPLFLKVKALPEKAIDFDPATESYTVAAPARFAAMLGVARPPAGARALPPPGHLFDDQGEVLGMALEAKRFACWCDCGWGKTPLGLEFARQVVHRTGKGFLITTMNEIVGQWCDESRKFYGDALPIRRLGSRAEMREWCGSGAPEVAIVNYEKWNPESRDDQVVKEVRRLGGVACDESHRLKTGGGKQKWAIIKSCKGVEYKLSLTATPAPNDVMEFASQAAFLEKLRSEQEILWTWFTRHPKTHRWTVRPHARAAFFEFMSSWSIYIRDPRRYGWRMGMAEVPPPETIVREVAMTPEQGRALRELTASPEGQLSFLDRDVNAIERGKLSQVAKGFVYRESGGRKRADPVPSLKPGVVAEIVREDARAGLQVLVWTVFNAETQILARELADLPGVVSITGATKKADRPAILDRFRRGEIPVLISRAKMLGHGMNFQNCGSMVFSGFDDSYVAFYQAIRRAYRQGQTRSVRVHLPVIPELEGDMLENLWRKQADHEAAIAEMEANYIRATRRLKGGAA